MTFLDVRTIFVICAFFIFLYGFGMIAFARKMSKSFKGIYLFAAVNFLIATGISLLLFRDYIDVAWTIIIANSLLIIACNLIYHAHLQFIGYKNQHIYLSVVLLIGIIILLLVFTYIIPNTNDRVIILSSFYSLQFFAIARTIRRFQLQTEQTRYTPLIIIAAVFAVFFVFRLVITIFSEQVDPYKLMYTPVQALATIFLMLYIAVLDFLVVLIASGQLVQKITDLAHKDSLTTLYNRRGLDYTLENKAIFTKPLAVIMCDIDHFKLINDRYGHHVGDIVLQAFALLIRESTRKTDICTRWGGEEFLIILPLTNEQEALNVAEKIRMACDLLTFKEYPDLSFTNSFGICCKSDSHNFDELIDDADHALYQAKIQGRNRACVFNSQAGIQT
jgi:diguanylate cyclase (GGDEF)-like protein